ncbi:cytochrome c biogenesis protein [Akkermansiaceae bacterium]|nr:cytochrome c biogenesis protein [Akkermansiaceae bacterium]
MKGWPYEASYRGMETGYLIGATVLAAAGAVFGWRSRGEEGLGHRAFWWMVGAFIFQLLFLGVRGELRGQCPLNDLGEICLFLAWSLTFFYLVTGSTYRFSLLGVFTAPVVVVLQFVTLMPGALDVNPQRVEVVDAWRESHAAFSVLSYGALTLAAVAGVMFLVLNKQLKKRQLQGGIMTGMPSVSRLVQAMARIAAVGWIVLTIGVVSGLLMEEGDINAHLIVAVVTWVLYAVLLGIYFVRGLPGRQLAWGLIILFVLSLVVFGKL